MPEILLGIPERLSHLKKGSNIINVAFTSFHLLFVKDLMTKGRHSHATYGQPREDRTVAKKSDLSINLR